MHNTAFLHPEFAFYRHKVGVIDGAYAFCDRHTEGKHSGGVRWDGRMTTGRPTEAKDVNLITGISSSNIGNSDRAHLVKPSQAACVDNDVTASALLPLTTSLQGHIHTHIAYTSAREFIDCHL